MESDVLVSVIVPIYNVARYLPVCLDSILAQTYRDFELILVDDGSPDECPAICDEYAGKDGRIRVIHKRNGGVSSARNAGIKISCGKFIVFIDPDDYIDADLLEYALDCHGSTGADIVVCGYRRVDEDGTLLLDEVARRQKVEVFSPEEAVINNFKGVCGFRPNTCGTLFLRRVVSLFDEGIMTAEDQPYIIGTYLNADRIAICDKAKYSYRQHNSGLSKGNNGFYEKGIRNCEHSLLETKRILDRHGVDADVYVAYHERRLRMHLGLMDRYFSYGGANREHRDQFLLIRKWLQEDARLAYARGGGYCHFFLAQMSSSTIWCSKS